MDKEFKKGDIVCMKSSMGKKYKIYYVVVWSNKDIVKIKRCSIIGPEPTYVYQASPAELVRQSVYSLEITAYIQKQLQENVDNISDELEFDLYLRNIRRNEAELNRRFINNKCDLILLFKRDSTKRRVFELKNAELVNRPFYINCRAAVITKYVKLRIGRKMYVYNE